MTHRSAIDFPATFRQTGFLWTVLLGLTSLGLVGCGESEPASTDQGGSGQASGQPETPETPVGPLETGEDVLKAMVGAYQNASSYRDNGSVSVAFTVGDQKIEGSAPFAVKMVQPDKFRADIYRTVVICDGQYVRAFHLDLPGEVLRREFQGPLVPASVYCDPILNRGMAEEGAAGPSPILMLLLEEDPLSILLDKAKAALLEPGRIGDLDCHRVEIQRDDGSAVFWIDQETLALRRIEYATDPWKKQLEAESGQEVSGMTLVAEFAGATLNDGAGDEQFKFVMPDDAEYVSYIHPPSPGQLAGEKVPDVVLYDLEGQEVSLPDKTLVLNLFNTASPASQRAMIRLEEVYQKYKDNEEVSVLGVSVDSPDLDAAMLAATLADWEVHVPIVRDTKLQLPRVFKVDHLPALYVLDSDGVLQHYEAGDNINLTTDLPPKIDLVIAGQDIYHPLRQAYHDYLKHYEKTELAAADEQSAGGTIIEQHELPQTEVAPKSDPTSLRLAPLWKYQDVTKPGNILVVPGEAGTPRILAIEAFRSVVELNPDGTKAATHHLKLDEREAVASFRTVVAADGKRYFVVFANAHQRLHLFDENWNLLCHFPEDALENQHSGIGDVQLADLDGDGTPEMCVGYWGVVGVQGVSLEGKRIWSNRSLASVLHIGIGAPGADGRRNVYCVNSDGSLAVLDAAGQSQGRVVLLGRPLNTIQTADLLGNGKLQWCGLSAPQLGINLAVGFNLKGEELWRYELPQGMRQQMTELIVPGNLRAQGPGQWLFPGADGSIHILSPDGQLIDKFNHGDVIGGLATAMIDGRPVLLIASEKGLEALALE